MSSFKPESICHLAPNLNPWFAHLMLYAFLGSALLGALSTAFLLWRKSVVEKKLVKSEAERKTAQDEANRALSELSERQKVFDDQLARQRDEIETLRKQRDEAIDKLPSGSIADLLRSRHTKTGNP